MRYAPPLLGRIASGGCGRGGLDGESNGGSAAAPKRWLFVPVPEGSTKREPFCSTPPTRKLQARADVGHGVRKACLIAAI